MRTCYDSVDVALLPDGGDLYLAYDDGKYNNFAAVKDRFPGKPVAACTVNPNDNEGDVLDVENGDATPTQAPAWVQRRRAAGHPHPIVYCSQASFPIVQTRFNQAGVVYPGWWIASYPGIGAMLYAGTTAHQYQSGPGYDISVVVDYLPGIDPDPTPTPTPVTGEPVTLPTGAHMHPVGITVAVKTGKGYAPSPVLAAKIVSIVILDENPGAVQRYDAIPTGVAVATQGAGGSPNGSVVLSGGSDGTYGVRLWVLT